MLATKRFRAGYRPHGRLRQRNYGAGSRAQFVPKKKYSWIKLESSGFDKEKTEVIVDVSLLKEHLKDGDDVYVHFPKGVPLGLFAGVKVAKFKSRYLATLITSLKRQKKKLEIPSFCKNEENKNLVQVSF